MATQQDSQMNVSSESDSPVQENPMTQNPISAPASTPQQQSPSTSKCYKLCESDDADLLLGLEAMGILCVTYNNQAAMTSYMNTLPEYKNVNVNTQAKEIDTLWAGIANIVSYTVWNEEYRVPGCCERKRAPYLASQCVTGS